MKGLLANRPAANTVDEGTLYFAEDASTLSYSDGYDWFGFGPMLRMVEPADPAFWTWTNRGDSTACKANGVVRVNFRHPSSGQLIDLAAPTSLEDTYEITARIVPHPVPDASNHFCGIGVKDSSTGKRCLLMFGRSGGVPQVLMATHDVVENAGGSVQLQGYPNGSMPVWLRISNDGTLRKFEYSYDGVFFRTLAEESAEEYCEEDQVCFFGYNDSNGVNLGFTCDSLEVVGI